MNCQKHDSMKQCHRIFHKKLKSKCLISIKQAYKTFFAGCMVVISYTMVGTLIVATIYLQLIQNRYMFRSFTALHCSHQHCVQPVVSDVEVVGYL